MEELYIENKKIYGPISSVPSVVGKTISRRQHNATDYFFLTEQVPVHFNCNFNNLEFLRINDYFLRKLDHRNATFSRDFDLLYKKFPDITVQPTEPHTIINVHLFSEPEITNLFFEITQIDFLEENIPISFLESDVKKFHLKFMKLAEEDRMAMCEKCIYGPGYKLKGKCDKIYKNAILKKEEYVDFNSN